jgi:hypothetical protein
VLKDLASKGSGAVEKFMAQHELLPAVGKTAVKKIETGAQTIDTGVNKLFTGGKGTVSKAITSQYPGLSKEGIEKHFTKIEEENLIKPTKQSGSTFKDATQIYKNAKNQKIDLEKIATNNQVFNKDLVLDVKYNTLDVANTLRKDTMQKCPDMLRPALLEAEPGVQKIPINEVRTRMQSKINKIPPSKITDAERQKLLNNITQEFGDGSPSALAHPNGYSLTDLNDSTIAAAGNVKPGSWAAPLKVEDTLSNTYYKTQADTFRKLLEDTAPSGIGVKEFKKKMQERFMLADYLEKLNGKKAPTSLFQGALRTGAKVSGAALGGSTGNVFGAFGGYHAGGMAMDSFMNASNPIKSAYLKQVKVAEPEIFNAIKSYIGEQQTARLMRLQLPAPTTIFKGPTQTRTTIYPK